MTAKKWFVTFTGIFIGILALLVVMVAVLDPFFHYHAPLSSFYYTLDNERSQNNGIARNFEFNALITGTSMTENFKTSELDELFGVNSVKMCYSGAMYKEINDNVEVALANNDVDIVVRGLDNFYLIQDKDDLRDDLGEYPEYLYNDNIFDDVYYIFNKGIIVNYCFQMIAKKLMGVEGGITSFDDYSNWMSEASFGAENVLAGRDSFGEPTEEVHLTDEEREMLIANIEQNVVSVARNNPDVTFYYFYTPYSIAKWGGDYEDGTIYREMEAVLITTQMCLEYDNIKLFDFNTNTDVITNLDNYRDSGHYGEWINSWILECMQNGDYQLTEDNYEEMIAEEQEIFLSYDYNSLFE